MTIDVARRGHLPHDLGAEAGVLGGVLLRPDVLAQLADLEVDDFYDPRHQAVFAAYRNLEATKRPIDLVTLEGELARAGRFDSIGGFAFLGDIAMRVPSPDNVVDYAKTVKDHHITREIMVSMASLLDAARAGEVPGESLIGEVQEIAARALRRLPTTVIKLGDVVKSEAKRIEVLADQIEAGGMVYTGIPTSIRSIDEFLGGIPAGLPVVIAARPAGCKTTIMESWLDAMGDHDPQRGISVLFTNEDRAPGLSHRLIGSSSGVPTGQITRADLRGRDVRAQFRAGVASAAQTRLRIVHCHGWTAAKIARYALRLAHEFGLIAWGVDYLQKVAPAPGIRDRVQQLSEIMKTLSNAAGELGAFGAASLFAVQLKRPPDGDVAPEPTMEALKGAGDFEEDGKIIIALHDPYLNGHRTVVNGEVVVTHRKTKNPIQDWNLEAHLLKNHQGQPNVVFPLHWVRPCHRVHGLCKLCKQSPAPPHHTFCAVCERANATGGHAGTQVPLGLPPPEYS